MTHIDGVCTDQGMEATYAAVIPRGFAPFPKAVRRASVHELRIWKFFAALTAVAVVAMLALIGTSIWWNATDKHVDYAHKQLQTVAVRPANSTEEGGLLAYPATQRNPKAPTVEVYVDFLCPVCGELSRQLDPTLIRMQEAGQINLEFHPINFLDSSTTNHYSTRSASALAYVADHEPEHLGDFAAALFDKGFQPPESGERNVSNDQIVQQAIRAGVSRQVATESVNAKYDDFVNKATNYTTQRSDLYTTVNGQTGFFTPTIRVNGHVWHFNVLGNLRNAAQRFDGIVGIDAKDVGDGNVLPAIGATGGLATPGKGSKGAGQPKIVTCAAQPVTPCDK